MNRVLVIGAGSIDSRYIQCLKELGVPDVFACEPAEVNQKQVCGMFDIRDMFTNLTDWHSKILMVA